MINDLVLGKGELHLNLFTPGTKVGLGERYLGNTPGFTLTAAETAVERKTSLKGLRYTADRFVVERQYSGAMICDMISADNMNLWLGSTGIATTVAATDGGPVITETFPVRKGLGYQLGLSVSALGQRRLTAVVMKLGATIINQATNVVLDAERGRFTVLPNAANITDGAALTIEYKTLGYLRTINQAQRELKGSLRFIADNVYGRNTDYFFPFVSIQPDGGFDFKNADWQKLNFKMTVMKLFNKEPFYAGSFS